LSQTNLCGSTYLFAFVLDMTPASFRSVSLAREYSGNLTTFQRWWSISGYSGHRCYGPQASEEKRSMDHFAGMDVSVKETSVCILDDAGKIVKEVKVASEPQALLEGLGNPAYRFRRIGLEA